VNGCETATISITKSRAAHCVLTHMTATLPSAFDLERARPLPTVKLLLVGDEGVGKTSLMTRWTADEFNSCVASTIGIDFAIKIMEVDEQRVKLQIWDTAGQERFRTITQAYYRGAMGICICFDLTDDKSFRNVRYWMQNVERHSNNATHKVLVGTKSDLKDIRMVTAKEAHAMADEYGLQYFETSARDNVQVHKTFKEMTSTITRSDRLTNSNKAQETNRANLNKEQPSAPAGCWGRLFASFRSRPPIITDIQV